MKTGTCSYSVRTVDESDEETRTPCGNLAYKNGRCKFHLDGYLTHDTAAELRDLFWEEMRGSGAEPANCMGYILPSLARKGLALIDRPVNLDYARFPLSETDLSGIVFRKSASFVGAKFGGAAKFVGCKFQGRADFSLVEFQNGASNFKSANFCSAANFFKARFADGMFEWAKFAESDFRKSIFRGNATFKNATFEGPADLRWSSFRGQATFEESEFRDRADLRWSSFRGQATFEASEFGDRADFGGARFEDRMNFRGVRAKHHDLIRFDGNVSNVSFLNTNMKEVDFGSDVTWLPLEGDGGGRMPFTGEARPGNSKHGEQGSRHCTWNRKCRTCDEEDLDGGVADPRLNAESVKNVYRDLRDNFDRQLRYDVAGGFFIREMEIGRKYKGGRSTSMKRLPWRALTWHAVYNALSAYGQSTRRPLAFLFGILSTGALLLWCPSEVLPLVGVPCEDDIGRSALRSLMSLVPIPLFGGGTEVDSALKIAALPALATLVLALRRRFEKARRH